MGKETAIEWTDRIPDLVNALEVAKQSDYPAAPEVCDQAIDALEAQAAEIERLRLQVADLSYVMGDVWSALIVGDMNKADLLNRIDYAKDRLRTAVQNYRPTTPPQEGE